MKFGDYYSLMHQTVLRNITEENYIFKKKDIINLCINYINEDSII